MKQFQFFCIRDYHELNYYKQAWDNLWEQTGKNIFSSFAWNYALLKAKAECNIQIDAQIWFLCESGTPTCIAPLKRTDGTCISFLSNSQADYQDFIYVNANSCDRMLQMLKNEYAGFSFRLSDIPEQSQTPDLFFKRFIGTKRQVSDICPYVTIVDNTEQYLAGKDYRRKKSKLLREGKVQIKHISNVNLILHHLQIMKTFFQQRWQDDEQSFFFFEKFDDVFMEEITKLLGNNDWVLLTVLYANDDPIAYYYGFIQGNTYLFYRSAFHASYSAFSPGMIALNELFYYCSKNGIQRFDFMRGDYSYKKKYTAKHTKNVLLEA